MIEDLANECRKPDCREKDLWSKEKLESEFTAELKKLDKGINMISETDKAKTLWKWRNNEI